MGIFNVATCTGKHFVTTLYFRNRQEHAEFDKALLKFENRSSEDKRIQAELSEVRSNIEFLTDVAKRNQEYPVNVVLDLQNVDNPLQTTKELLARAATASKCDFQSACYGTELWIFFKDKKVKALFDLIACARSLLPFRVAS